MKLLKVEMARSIWFGNTNDLNPFGINIYPRMFSLLSETYKFVTMPSLEDVLSKPQEGMKFKAGEFRVDPQGMPIQVELSIFSDGIVAETKSSTDDSDFFLADFLKRVSGEFSLPNYEDILQRKAYVSHLFVTTDKNMEILNSKLKQLAKYISDNIDGGYLFEFGGLSFIPNPTKSNPPPTFVFERAANTPFPEKRYSTSAPLPTQKHLEALNKLEKILS